MAKKIFTIIGKALLGIIGAWIALLLLLEAYLSPTVMSKIVRKVAEEYVDGSLDFTTARASIFKRFPLWQNFLPQRKSTCRSCWTNISQEKSTSSASWDLLPQGRPAMPCSLPVRSMPY
jgi:hypothetical protein